MPQECCAQLRPPASPGLVLLRWPPTGRSLERPLNTNPLEIAPASGLFGSAGKRTRRRSDGLTRTAPSRCQDRAPLNGYRIIFSYTVNILSIKREPQATRCRQSFPQASPGRPRAMWRSKSCWRLNSNGCPGTSKNARPVPHLVDGMQHVRPPPGLGGLDRQRRSQRQLEESS